jgi:SAM-dependent methyltransferase
MPGSEVSNDGAARAFSAQSTHYDSDDRSNHVIQDLRKQVYEHVERYLKPASRILELNAGTGIDALYFMSKGHSVLATDIADGMIRELTKKHIPTRQLSYENLDRLDEKFDYVFSNLGGLNCTDDLSRVTKNLPAILNPKGFVTVVIMPRVSPWEIMSAFKLNGNAFRRLKKDGVMAHIDGMYFRTWYFSLLEIRKAFGDKFELICNEGLAAISPPPHKTNFFAYKISRKLDAVVRKTFPFNRWADHIIVTFRLK